MSITVPFKCQCGQVEGHVKNVSKNNGNHVACMCIDCQTYAHYLQSEARELNANGGTELYQTTPNNVEITSGQNQIKLLKLTPKGAERFYAACCSTPIANNLSATMSFTGLPTSNLDFEAVDTNKEQCIGPIQYHCMSKYGYGDLPHGAHPGFPLSLTLKIMRQILVGKVTKSYRPHAFYDDVTQQPISAASLIDKAEKEKLVEKIQDTKP